MFKIELNLPVKENYSEYFKVPINTYFFAKSYIKKKKKKKMCSAFLWHKNETEPDGLLLLYFFP